MKTTVEISDVLLHQARRLAAREHTTVKALVEEGLRHVVAERKRPSEFKLRKVTFGGRGLQPALREASWDQIRDLSYEGHGA